MPPPRKLKTQKKARPEPCLLYWGCRRTRHLDRKLFREDCGGSRRLLPHWSEAAALPTATGFQQQPAPARQKGILDSHSLSTVREGAFVGEP